MGYILVEPFFENIVSHSFRTISQRSWLQATEHNFGRLKKKNDFIQKILRILRLKGKIGSLA